MFTPRVHRALFFAAAAVPADLVRSTVLNPQLLVFPEITAFGVISVDKWRFIHDHTGLRFCVQEGR